MRRLAVPQARRAAGGGFTLVEAMIVVLIVAVVAAVAFPAARDMIAGQRVKSAAFELVADLTYARAEAIARGTDVVMGSAGASTDWGTGWTIVEQTGRTTLRTGGSLTSDIRFAGTAAAVTFERTGRAAAAGTVTFSIESVHPDAPDHHKRCIRLDPSGRARSAVGACA